MSVSELERDLREAGVAPRVAAYVASQNPYSWYRSGWIALAVLCASFFGVIALLIALKHMADARALQAAFKIGAVLYESHFLFGFTIAVLAWIFAAAAAMNALPLLSPRLLASAYADVMLRPPQGSRAKAARRYMLSLAGDTDPSTPAEVLLRNLVTQWARPLAFAAAALAALSAIVTWREINTYALYSPSAYVQRHFLPTAPTTHAWSDARILQTGCVHVSGRYGRNDLIYRIIFSDGDATNLGEAEPVRGGWIEQAERIDASLMAAHVSIRPRSDGESDAACLVAQGIQRARSDYPRLGRLLRL